MLILSATNLEKAYGTRVLFSGVCFDVQAGEKVALVGVNGCGKTALVRILSGQDKEYGGRFSLSKPAAIGYVEQHVDNYSKRSAYEEVLEVFRPLMELEEELFKVTQQLVAQPDQKLVERQHRLQEKLELEGGYTYKSRARAALLGLGFTPGMLDKQVTHLSGGEKAKVHLARMLLCGADLLLLDEPTNHLDIDSSAWLEEFLRDYRGAVLVISHDRYFLDKVTTRTLEMENQKVTSYNGGYTTYLEKKATGLDIQKKHYKTAMREVARMEESVKRFRQWNREKSIRKAENKEKQIERLKSTIEEPDKELKELRFAFTAREVSGNDVVRAKGLSKAFGEKTLFAAADMELFKGERVFLLGPNGCGKTTLFRILLGLTPPDSGYCAFGANVHKGYYDQTQATLAKENTVIDEIWNAAPHMSQTQVRSALGAFLFSSEEVFKPITALSGGEKARVALLKLMLSGANLLLLDEPTNHLDIGSREALEDALSGYDGTMFIISHDRYFINKLADRILTLSPRGMESYTGNYDAYLEKRRPIQEEEKVQSAPKVYWDEKEKRAQERRRKGKLERAEQAAARCEEAISQLERELCRDDVTGDYELAMKLAQELEAKRLECDELYAAWAALEEEDGE